MRAATSASLAVMALTLLAGCDRKAQTKQPLLTKEAFLDAARKCGAQQPEFIQQFDGKEPSFSYLESDAPGTQATPTSQCLAEALKEYRFGAMKIRFEHPNSAAR